MMNIAKIIVLILGATLLSGCATAMISLKAKPPNEGNVVQQKYSIYDATGARINEEGSLLVCVVGGAFGEENTVYGLILKSSKTGLVNARISWNDADPEILPIYNMEPGEIAKACGDNPPGHAANMVTLDNPLPEPVPETYTAYTHTPITNTELRNLLSGLEKPQGLTVMAIKRAQYCTEVIVWNPAADAPEMELIRISAPTAEWTVTGNRAWYLLTPFAVLIDIVTLPFQTMILEDMFGSAYARELMVEC